MTQQKERERAAGRAWTPGPWEVDRKEPGELWIAGAGRQHPVCMVTASGFVTEQDEADARLIAAAPELFEALADCALEIAQIRNRKLTAGEQAALDRARAILSRAGESP